MLTRLRSQALKTKVYRDPKPEPKDKDKDKALTKPEPKPKDKSNGKPEPKDKDPLDALDQDPADDDDDLNLDDDDQILDDDDQDDDDDDDDLDALDDKGAKDKKPEPPKTLEEATKLISKLTNELHKANKEAARRRLQAKQQRESKTKENAEELTKVQAKLKLMEDEKSFTSLVAKAKLTFANEKASEDAFTYTRAVLAQEGNEEMKFGTALKLVLKERPHLLERTAPPDTDSVVKSNNNGDLLLDEEAIANQFGIPYVTPKSKQGE